MGGRPTARQGRGVTTRLGRQLIGLSLSSSRGIQVASAKETATKIEAELGNLNTTLKNIEDARPFEQLSVRSLLFLPSSISTRADRALWDFFSSTMSPRPAPRSPRLLRR
jgi:hypothetical protein